MGLCVKALKSAILSKTMNIAVYRPDGYENIRLPVLYFLHGRSGDESLLKNLGMHKLADELFSAGQIKPFIIVCPELDNSRGINSAENYHEIRGRYSVVHKGRYEDYLIEEVIPFIDTLFCTDRRRNGRYIGGVSSGGYAALHIGLRHTDMFSKIGGHMPAVDLSFYDEDEIYFENEEMWLKYDPVSISKKGSFDNISIYLDDGKDDEGKFYIACEKLYIVLKSKGADVRYILSDGCHNERYVLSNLRKYMMFYGEMPEKRFNTNEMRDEY